MPMTNFNALSRRTVLTGAAVCFLGVSPQTSLVADDKSPSRQIAPLDLLVIAPHSDDEAIGCAGVILQAIELRKRVGVVVVTAGDGFPKAAAAVAKKKPEELTPADFIQVAELRQRHSIRGMSRIGVATNDLMFLGYPDSGLADMYQAAGDTTYRQRYTQKSATYGVVTPDYHSIVHGRAASYLKTSVIADLAEIITARKPKEIYVTNEADSHSDHQATFWFVRDAAQAAGYQGELLTYIVHGSQPPQPPTRRVPLSETHQRAKRALLEEYQVGLTPVHDELAEKFTKPEELFWAVNTRSLINSGT